MMKKLLLFSLAVVLSAAVSFGQSDDDVLKTKKGVPIMPQSGDWAIGIDATPFFQYAGNMFSGFNNFVPSWGFTAQNPGAIFGKYKKSATTAYRATLLFGFSNITMKDANATDPTQTDKLTWTALNIGLMAGIEKNRTIFGRLSGIYGVQAGIMYDPYDDGAGNFGSVSFKDAVNSTFDVKQTGGGTMAIGVGGFVGVEFYFAPRMALAGEFGYDLYYMMTSDRMNKPSSGTETTLVYGGSGINLAPSASGRLQLLFYF